MEWSIDLNSPINAVDLTIQFVIVLHLIVKQCFMWYSLSKLDANIARVVQKLN